jgi:hypothetical protein
LKHPYFDGFTLASNNNNLSQSGADGPGKNFLNGMQNSNDFAKPGSKARIESRKGVLSRKSNINKNSFYRSKGGVNKVPEYLPNKPNVVGSRGGLNAGAQQPYNIREKKSRGGGIGSSGSGSGVGLPNLKSSGGGS